MSRPTGDELDGILRETGEAARGSLSELLELVRQRCGGAWVNMDLDVQDSMSRIKCSRSVCGRVGRYPHRDLPLNRYCERCARLINFTCGEELVRIPVGEAP